MITISSAAVNEGSIAGRVVGVLSAPGLAGDVAFEILSGTPDGAFVIVGNLLVVANGALLDFETSQTAQLEIHAFDGGGGTTTSTLDINVQDLNEIPGTP